MTKLLQRGIKAVESLSPERQDLAGEILLEIAGKSPPPYQLTPEQIGDLKESIAEADRGEFVSEAEIEEMWRSFER